MSRAIDEYEKLIERVMAAKPDVEHDLRAAYSLSLLYRDQIELYRTAGAAEKAESVEAKRLAIWKQWAEQLPGNPFVLKQFAATHPDPER